MSEEHVRYKASDIEDTITRKQLKHYKIATETGDKGVIQPPLPPEEFNFRCVLDKLLALWQDKNKRYENSFNKALDEFGLVSGVAQIFHKMNRLIYLVKIIENKAIDRDERTKASAEFLDGLDDLANYAIMTRAWIGTDAFIDF